MKKVVVIVIIVLFLFGIVVFGEDDKDTVKTNKLVNVYFKLYDYLFLIILLFLEVQLPDLSF
jgi:hypothetical protein